MFTKKQDGLSRVALSDTSQKPSPENPFDAPFAMKKRQKTVKPSKLKTKVLRRILIGFVVLAVIYTIPTFLLIKDAKGAKTGAAQLNAGLKSQNIDDLKAGSTALHTSIKHLKRDLVPFWPIQFVPFAGSYISDANHMLRAGDHGLNALDIALDALAPHAELLGLKGKDTNKTGNAQEKVQLAVAALREVTPKFDQIAQEFTAFSDEFSHINPNRYPKQIKGKAVRDRIISAKTTVVQLAGLVKEAKPLAESLPNILGLDSPKTYLVLFQNDKELRPSGGFLTAYTYVTFDKGKIFAADSNDIYNLDETIHKICLHRECPELRPPELIIRYLPEATGQRKTAWDSRDSNIHPDWVASTLEFQKFYNIAGGKKIDGIIGVDTYVIRDLLKVTGPIKVTGYPKEFTSDNVVDQLEGYAENVFKGSSDRKSLLGDLMASVMQYVTNAGGTKINDLVQTTITLLNEKHVLISLSDDTSQNAVERFNWAGRIKSFEGDYLHINDSNFASGKANLFVKERVEDKVDLDKDGSILHTLKIFYEDPGSYSDTLNRNYRDAVRIYVPKGSTVLSSDGASNALLTTEDTNFQKTVIEAYVFTRAKGKSTFTVSYKTPLKMKKGDDYKLMIQKQPGTEGWEYKMNLFGSDQKPFNLIQDRVLNVKI